MLPHKWLLKLKNESLATLFFAWVLIIHLLSLFLFTRGFLLSRHSLDTVNNCSATQPDCTLAPTHKRAVLLIIDALRFDFISSDPSNHFDPNHHGVLTLPSELTLAQPTNSFIFNAYADPPTATLQRIRGITTGSLPTFIDIGSNFGGSAIAEDSLINQLQIANKRIAFMGDDTWNVAYPARFQQNMTFPFDSFNVEDLHTVDEGVIRHLFPLLEANSRGDWDFIIGHFLGVDHVGHRVGPGHSTMRAKLTQMDKTLRKVVEMLDDETLLVVLGDHGMDRKGDHGGDGDLETQSAMWIYSKRPLTSGAALKTLDKLDLPVTVFPGSSVPHRSIQQIDIVPTISLLLGLPIPFNSLGTIIPEIFARPSDQPSGIFGLKAKQAEFSDALTKAMRINARQIWNYLQAYQASPSGGELDPILDSLQSAWESGLKEANTPTQNFIALLQFTRAALWQCRLLWARFNIVLMYAGLSMLGMSLASLIAIYRLLDGDRERWPAIIQGLVRKSAAGVLVGIPIGVFAKVLLDKTADYDNTFSWLQAAAAGVVFGSQLAVLVSYAGQAISSSTSNSTFHQTYLPIAIILLHTVSYLSNSFLMWEDRLVQYLLIALLSSTLLASASSPTHQLRLRILSFSILTGLVLRIISTSTVCREEQHPYCHVTFYSSASLPSAPTIALIAAPLLAYLLPSIFLRFLAISISDKGVAPFFMDKLWKALLLAGSGYWLLERLEMWDGLNQDRLPLVQMIRITVARLALGGTVVGGGIFWWYSPLCIELREESPTADSKKRMVILGFANVYGSSYLLFFAVCFALVFAVTQLSGQWVLALGAVALLSYIEVVDSQRDTAAMSQAFKKVQSLETFNGISDLPSPQPTIAPPVFIVLLSLLLFYTTGHQSVLSTIQWKSAFFGFPVVTYPFSPILVVLNTFGPLLIPILATPLFALWKVSPTVSNDVSGASKAPSGTSSNLVLSDTIKYSLGVIVYHSCLTFGTALSAAILRRHLMVWKVFAPRFMMGAVSLLVVDVGVLFAVGVGVRRVLGKVHQTFEKK